MKQLITCLVFLCVSGLLFAQAPQKFNYQGIARDVQGHPLAVQHLSLKLSVLPTADATVPEFEEVQQVTTNEFGLYTLQIGGGTALSGTMNDVKWETGNKYIRVAIDPKGGSDFVDAGTTQLLSVPYALYADKAGIARESVSNVTHTTRATNNFIEKTSNTGVVNSNSQLYDDGSGVALGFTSPVYTFESRKSSNTDWCLRTTDVSGASRAAFRIQNEDSTLGQIDITKFGKNYGGAFMGISRNNMAVMNSLTGPFVLNCGGDMVFGNSLTVSPFTQTPRITINGSTGNVGVGLALGAAAAAKLEVNGQVKINGGSPGLGKVLTSDANGLATWQNASAAGISGTQNYMSKFTSANAIGNSQIFDNGAGVAIGFANPIYTFESRKNTNTDWCLRTTNTAGTSRSALRIQNEDSTLGQIDITKFGKLYGGTFMGISRNNMAVINSLTGPFVLNCGGDMVFGSSLTVAPFTQTPRITINGSTGNVGIGLPLGGAAGAKLEVNGQVKITGGTPGLGKVLTSDANGLATWETPTGGGGGGISGSGTTNFLPKYVSATAIGNSMLFDNGSSVGIGTTSPSASAKLDVSGQIKISGGTPGAGKVLTSDATGLATWQTPTTVNPQWTASGANIYNSNSGNVGVGVTNPLYKLHVAGTATGNQVPVFRAEYAGPSSSTDVIGVEGISTPEAFYGIGVSGTGNYMGVRGYSPKGYGVRAFSDSSIGIFANSLSSYGVLSTSGTNYGLVSTSDSTSAGVFQSGNPAGNALYSGVLRGEYTGSSSLDFVGVSGTSSPAYGYGIGVSGQGGYYGVRGYGGYTGLFGYLTPGSTGNAVYGDGGANGTGVFGFSVNQNGVDAASINGSAVNAYSGTGNGVNSFSPSNTSGYFNSGDTSMSSYLLNDGVVLGEYIGSKVQDAVGVTGRSVMNSNYGIGVVGDGNYMGVFGTGSLFAGYFYGNLYASNASSSIKSFKIDHPADPANKYLYHSSVESNDMMNIYNGNIVTDANGDATVTLPSYFELLNIDFKYQLTVIGTFAQAIISEEVNNNQFKIKTNQPNVKVSWQVTGVRNDAMAKAHRIQPEVEKTGREKGKYLNPVELGRPLSEGLVAEGQLTHSSSAARVEQARARMREHEDMQKRNKVSMPSAVKPVQRPLTRR